MSWRPNLLTRNLIQQWIDMLLTDLPYKLGVDEIIPGCQVINNDVDGVGAGVYPRLMEVALRDQEYYFAVARGNVTLANGDYCTIIHIRDGDLYEILNAGGSTGSSSAVPAGVRGDILRYEAAGWAAYNHPGAAGRYLTTDVNDPIWSDYPPLEYVTGVTRTVGIAQQHADIQSAVDWFDGKGGDGKISLVTAGTYNQQVVVNNPFIDLEIEGDTRAVAGLGYVDGAACNGAGIANGGTGVVTLASAGNVITVTMTIANPAFDTAGWTNADSVLIFDNAGAWVEWSISAVLNNTITLTNPAPAVGNDATAMFLVPNRRIFPVAVNATCLLMTDTPRLTLDGIYIYPPLATSTGVRLEGYGNLTLENILINAERCVYQIGNQLGSQPTIDARSGAVSFVDGTWGVLLQGNSVAQLDYTVCVDCTAGLSATMGSYIYAEEAIVVESNQAYYAHWSSTIYAEGAWARQNTTAYYAAARSYIWAVNTNANNNGNIVNYNPAVSDAWGNNNGSITWT